MTEIKLNLEDPALAVHVLAVAAMLYEKDKDLDAVGICLRMADQIEVQVKPAAIEEPEAFGSIVRAASPQDPLPEFWVPTPRRKHYWMSASGLCEVWSELTDVEVLRVGVGDPDGDSYDAGFFDGRRAMNTQTHVGITGLREEAITAERQSGLDKALQLVEELAP